MNDTKPTVSFNEVIGTPGIFEQGMDVTIFESKLTNFFLAIGIENEVKKKAILLSSVSEEIHKILYSLCVPSTPDTQTYSTLLKLLKQYYKPVKSYFAARHTFYLAKQRTDETVAEWGARVKNLGSKCKFSSELTTVIRNIFVVGMSPGKIQDRLIEEDASDLKSTYANLMDIATIKEATIREKNTWKQNESELNYQKQLHPNKQVNRQPSDKLKCGVCGRSNHLQRNCRYKDYSCKICNSKGHLAPICKNGKSFKQNYDNRSYTKFLTENFNETVDDQAVAYNLSDTFFNLIETNSQNRIKPFTTNLLIENVDVKFEIDTGSLHSVISNKMYSALFSNITMLNNDISLSDYVGNNINPIGKIEPRSIPLALKNKVETEIDRLVKNKILVPLNYSEWATPIVPILKFDGTVRICGDFKITINPVLKGTEYPLRKIEHLYANISGSKYFSKIDLKDGYQQMVIKESDRKPTLAHFDQKLPLKLIVDSSSYALGAVLSHVYPDNSEKPVAFASRILSDAECKFPQIEKEGLAIIFDWSKIKIEINRDQITSRVLHATKTGEWSDDFTLNNDLKPYVTPKNEITLEQGCLLWGYRVIIPQKFHKNILAELHSCHIGMTSMKGLARSYFWWPTIDKDIENMVRDCYECTNVRPNPPKSTITQWRWPQRPRTRVHCDYLGPHRNKFILIFVDATSKWLEAFSVNSMTAQTVITKFSELFARFGILRTITTDGAKCFSGIEFENYCKKLGIRHLMGAPFHPASNGCAESGVKIVKQFLKKCSFSLNQLNKFLLMHRNTPQTTTHETPAKLMLGHSTRTIFDLLIPGTNEVVVDSQISQIKYGENRNINVKEGDCVLVKDYRNTGENWQKATVTENISDKTHKVTLDQGPTWTSHDDQIWPLNKTSGSLSSVGENTDIDNNDHTESTVPLCNKSPRPVRIKKPIQRFSPSDYK
ncbi:uncharacterized protein LOC126899076 [Daktulosphaira vitifoliae]|uniref:uncharacterized protein LOC126899076 n=1 Tax=Daktulosphaira vitifoliae TaxID=58002 RepID=UPI0021AAC1BC|nr:uncharacterized protein LOC126899076 [Daktulosphaira vitifoliae]